MKAQFASLEEKIKMILQLGVVQLFAKVHFGLALLDREVIPDLSRTEQSSEKQRRCVRQDREAKWPGMPRAHTLTPTGMEQG